MAPPPGRPRVVCVTISTLRPMRRPPKGVGPAREDDGYRPSRMPDDAEPPRHAALIGATASGKSALALALARQDPAFEIVSVDSMQVYRGMDIGTAKPTPAEQAAVPHHLLDVADPWEDYTVARYAAAAREAIAGIEARGRRALLVGGTGLYLRAAVDDLAVPGQV